ncbi:MAG: DNA polymerase III subunit alpha [Betaproteobacteria bacterium RIFCSPLOWO2_12_FULL_66_14]|nr:MAG: DNA polymerase III subunit alpha [Betaproteobacteria bacterium RIFCSPLOWO2_12_FULL_66_14]
MPRPKFVHLRLHSEYSIVDSVVRIDQAVERAALDAMPALALTDLANLFGMVKFFKSARATGVKPLVGCDVWITNEAERDKPHRMVLLVQSRVGYLTLCELLSRAWLQNQHRGRGEINKAWLERGTDGLICLSGALQGDIGAALVQNHVAQAEKLALGWAAFFPERFYVEVQRAAMPLTETYVQGAVALAGKLGLPVVATHPVRFLAAEEFTAHEARVCISEGYVLGDKRRPRAFTSQCHFRSQADMAQAFADLPEALANSVEIAKRCNFELELGKSKLPLFPTPSGVSLDDHLASQAKAGLARRLKALYPEAAERAQAEPAYRARLEFETGTITQMGFSGYFLIVADFINWAKSSGIPVGPGRGSGAGSLVAYALGITDLDPLKYRLLFERFLNPERVSMPDFDIDFCQEGRDRVIEYVRNKYGRDSVSQIATFGTMASKAVVRDVGRVLEWPYSRADELAKLIPFQPGKTITLRPRADPEDRQTIYAREVEPQLEQREQSDEETRQLLELAMQLEGLARNVGMHAGGVLIAPGKLTDFCPLYAAQGSDSVISQLDKDDVEAIGLVKFDFLGLTTLTILDWTTRHVRNLHEPAFQLERIPLDDPKAYEIFCSANTTAVFQFESRGMRDLLKRARPDRFEDIIALVALYRPGPMDLIPDFCERKHGRQVIDYPDPRVEPILSETYGIMVYQEQVMQMAQIIGGYSLGRADLLRRAMGKKKPEEMAEHRDIFREGAGKNGLAADKADELFDLMEKFAGYGFNKSHAAAYALVAYQTAYVKAHFPAAFMAANFTAVMNDTDKVHQFRQDATANGLKLLAPDINSGEYRFEPVDAKTIRYGLGAIKGTGESAISAIVAARRKDGPFRDLFEFCRRIDKRVLNRRAIEALVRAGAFDPVHAKPSEHRASLLASVGVALEAAEQAERHAQQASLFGAAEQAGHSVALVEAARWEQPETLANEKAALGFYFSGHPFDHYRRELSGFLKTRLVDLAPRMEPVLLAGIVAASRLQQTRSGRMAVLRLDDGSAEIEVTAFAELLEEKRELLREDQPVVIQGKVAKDEFSGSLRVRAEKIFDLASARNRFARLVRLSLNGEVSKEGAAGAARLKKLLEPYRNGSCSVEIRYENAGGAVAMRLPEEWRITPDEKLLAALRAWLKPENVEVLYS